PPQRKAVNGIAEGIAGFEWVLLSLPGKTRSSDATWKRKQQRNSASRRPSLPCPEIRRRVENLYRLPAVHRGEAKAVEALADEDFGRRAAGRVADGDDFGGHNDFLE